MDPTTLAQAPLSSGLSTTRPTRDGGRFAPGTILLDRYRVVGLLGRGGMGEVYRADDLRLEQAVALKFVPESVAGDPSRLAQFHNEVRVARQVTHKNVCRMYDLGEVDGVPFLSMEYVDGEDLGSLLRRIGRLPQDKAVEIARQLCAGLAAAHDRGVIHRDLKPANVMIDGQGQARLTDFGIAASAEGVTDVRSGTPAYMAPEQLAGKSVSVQSDLFSLGLVLYELFTGKRAIEVQSIADLVQLHDEGLRLRATAVVTDLDPAIDRAIARCLARDPSDRPTSALAVAAALPGGDPLLQALAAGETPSPEMVAAAGRTTAASTTTAVTLGTSFVVLLGLIAATNDRTLLIRQVPFDKPPAVLVDRARTLIEAAGYQARQADSAWSFEYSGDVLRYVRQERQGPDRWAWLPTGRTPSVHFAYRSSPRLLVPTGTDARPTPADPPMTVSGMMSVILDTDGRLLELHVVPPQRDEGEATGAVPAPDWGPLFDAARLPRDRFTEASPTWTPRAFADTRAAWTGTAPELPDVPLRIEAAAYQGRPVFFSTIGPWTRPARMLEAPETPVRRAAVALAALLTLAVFILAGAVAHRNLRSGRGDRTGAVRLAALVFAASLAGWLLQAHHVADAAREVDRLLTAAAFGLLGAGLLWIAYISLEPIVRRRWPESLISWTRLLGGRWRDPLVGRDLLIGLTAGAIMHLVVRGAGHVPTWFGEPPPTPAMINPDPLLGTHLLLGSVLGAVGGVLLSALVVFLVFTLIRLKVRWTWLAFALSTVGFALLISGEFIGGERLWFEVLMSLGVSGLLTAAAWWFGYTVLVAMLAVNQLLYRVPIVTDLSTWYAGTTVAGLLLLLGLAAFGVATVTGSWRSAPRALQPEP